MIYAGYEEVVTLSEKNNNDTLSATWNIVQLYPGGTILIPTTTSVVNTDYMAPMGSGLQVIEPDCVKVRITGKHQYKTGYGSVYVTGRIAYCNENGDGNAYLIIRNFYNNPASLYPEEPPDKPGLQGDSVFVYNDDGGLGGFGEMECMGQAVGGLSKKSSITDPMALWFYLGPIEKIRSIALQLLGCSCGGEQFI